MIGVGIGSAFHAAGSNGFDGLVRILPDGKLYVHTGVGNLGTYSYASTSRVPAEVLGYKWENVVIVRGRSDNHLPWMIGQFGSNTTYTASRGNYVAAVDAKNKLLEIGATVMGGAADRLRPQGRKGRAQDRRVEVAELRRRRQKGDRTRRQIFRQGLAAGHQPADQGFGHGAGRLWPDRCRQGQAAETRAGAGARRRLLHDRTRPRNRPVRDHGISRRRRLRHRAPSRGSADSDASAAA